MAPRAYKIILFLLILLSVCLYFLFEYGIFYSNDAYIYADVTQIASQLSAPVDKVFIKDNQWVKQGDLLVQIVAEPFNIAVQQQQALVAEAKQNYAVLLSDQAEQQATIQAQQAQLNYIVLTLQRYQKLFDTQAVARQQIDNLTSQKQVALANLTRAQAALANIKARMVLQQAVIAKAQSDLAAAQYNLSLTKIYAPSAGYINHLEVYAGEYLNVGQSLFGIVSGDTWQVIANYKESAVGHMRPGKKVWIYLSSHPWRLYTGSVVSIGRAVARNQLPDSNPALPYIPPTTDWIRYPYRFPVRIQFDQLPADVHLYRGSDVRTLVIR